MVSRRDRGYRGLGVDIPLWIGAGRVLDDPSESWEHIEAIAKDNGAGKPWKLPDTS